MNRNLVDERMQDKRIPLLPSLADRRNRRIRILCIVLGVLLLPPVCGYWYLDYLFNGDHRVAMLKIDRHRKLEIRADNFANYASSIWCHLITDGKVSSDLGTLGYSKDTDDLRFQLLKSNDASIVAIVEQSNPDVILLLHNFNTGQTYTEHDASNYNDDENELRQLRQAYSKVNLVLSRSVSPERKALIW